MPAAVSKKSAVSKVTEPVVEAKSPKKAAATPSKTIEPVVVSTAPAKTVEDPVTAPVPVAEVVETAAVAECPLTCKLNEIDTLVNEIDARIKDLKNKAKLLRKDVAVLVKMQQKATKKSSGSNANRTPRAPSGFAKPTTVTDEMYTFLGMDAGTPIARVDVTRKINEYIKTNNLQNPSDKRQIMPDAKLRDLLKLSPNDHVTFFNLQTFLSKHFVKTVAV